MSSLQTRLQDPGYINWVKAGLCLIHTKEGLEEFADNESNELHGNILAHLLPNTGHSLGRACISKTKLMTTCGDAYCQSFATAVIQEGIDPNHKFTIGKPNLANTDAGQWHSQPWELAKLFMNQGQLPTQTQPSQTDLSGIINFLTHCRVPRNHVTNVKLFDEVSLM